MYSFDFRVLVSSAITGWFAAIHSKKLVAGIHTWMTNFALAAVSLIFLLPLSIIISPCTPIFFASILLSICLDIGRGLTIIDGNLLYLIPLKNSLTNIE